MKSWKIQNEIIACIAEAIRRHIGLTLNNTKYFCLTADEVTDSYTNKEILPVCLRYIDLLREKPGIEETFLDSLHVQGRPTGEVIKTHILNILDKHKINLEHCPAQVYVGASAMSISNKGASAVVKEQQPKASYFHRISHCINLVIAFSCKNKVITWMDLSSVCYFFANSPKRQQYFEKFIDLYKKGLKAVSLIISISLDYQKQDGLNDLKPTTTILLFTNL